MAVGFEYVTSALAGLLIFHRSPVHDLRGGFDRLFDSVTVAAAGSQIEIQHVNLATNLTKGTIRGLHYQVSPYCETKVVTCLRGRAFDVVVDIRAGSPTFLESHVELLSPSASKTIVIPPGFAHGYQTLEDETELLYLHSVGFVPDAERGLHPFDDLLSIDWPLKSPIISERDSQHPPIAVGWEGVEH
jgi:dTDP-4-dehydrorhamnose 3,5-epimerase